MKCPHCEARFSNPGGHHANVHGVEVLMVVCPECETVLGVIHHSHAAYFTRKLTREKLTSEVRVTSQR